HRHGRPGQASGAAGRHNPSRRRRLDPGRPRAAQPRRNDYEEVTTNETLTKKTGRFRTGRFLDREAKEKRSITQRRKDAKGTRCMGILRSNRCELISLRLRAFA